MGKTRETMALFACCCASTSGSPPSTCVSVRRLSTSCQYQDSRTQTRSMTPREQDLVERTLRKKLGSYFDPNFMSISLPMLVNLSETHVKLHEIEKLNLTETPFGKRVEVGKEARRTFLQLLWTYTHAQCPVVYTWKDLGIRFWPRYIKEWKCFAEGSCSFPEGMSCKASKFINKIFLWWDCHGFLKQKYCTWKLVQYPIISECKCSC